MLNPAPPLSCPASLRPSPSPQAVPHHARHADQAPRLHAGRHVPGGHAGQRAARRAGAPVPGPVLAVCWVVFDGPAPCMSTVDATCSRQA